MLIIIKLIGGVMVSVIVSSAVDRKVKPGLNKVRQRG